MVTARTAAQSNGTLSQGCNREPSCVVFTVTMSMRGPALSSFGARPPLWREARIGLEAAALVRDPIFRGDGMADGRGRPVLLIPGFLAGDGSLSPMAGWLKRAGYRPSRAGIVSNVNCAGVLMPRLEKRLERLVSLQGQRAAIVGQSRGGTLAKVLGHRRPDLVSGVVALGAPQVDPLAVHPLVRLQVEAVSRLGSLGAPGLFKRSCLDGDCCSSFWDDLAEPLPPGVQLFAVYSKSDGIVDWHSCLDPHATELVEISASHCGMAVSRAAWRAVADALDSFREAEARRRAPTRGRLHRLPRAA
jgi:pimeloyl-ACP methyl ester carboxylesterase